MYLIASLCFAFPVIRVPSDSRLREALPVNVALGMRNHGAPNTNRTCDLPLRRGLLYPLSYRGDARILTEIQWPTLARGVRRDSRQRGKSKVIPHPHPNLPLEGEGEFGSQAASGAASHERIVDSGTLLGIQWRPTALHLYGTRQLLKYSCLPPLLGEGRGGDGVSCAFRSCRSPMQFEKNWLAEKLKNAA